MKVTVRKRKYPDGRVVWSADIHVAPAGSREVERFRLIAPDGVTSRSGCERWAMETARRIAVEGRPPNTRKARAEKVEREAAERAAFVPTLAEFWPMFVDYMRAERRKPATMELYAQLARLKLMPLLGGSRLDQIGELDIQRIKSSMSDAAASHVNSTIGLLLVLLRVAKLHHPAVTVPSNIKRVKRTTPDRLRFYTPEQKRAMLLAETRPERSAALTLAFDAGLRKSECAALRWQDIDFARGELTVRHTLHRGVLLSPKSGKPRRIPLTARLTAALRQLDRTDEWVLPRSAGTKAGSRRAGGPLGLESVVRVAAKAAGVPNYGAHACRHSFATHLLAKGRDLAWVSRMLGHSSVAITAAVYIHALPGGDRSAVAVLDDEPEDATVTDLAPARARLRRDH